MKERTTRSLLRSVALVGAMAAGATAFGDYWKEWTPTEKANWDADGSWTASGSEGILSDYRVGLAGAQIAFDKAVTDDAANLYVFANDATFSADDASYGLTKNNWLCVGVWFGGDATATFESGTYSFSEINVGRWTASDGENTWACNGTLNISGATVTTPTVYAGTDVVTGDINLTGGTLNANIDGTAKGTLTFNGGTLSTESVSGVAVVVGENGGTINTEELAEMTSALSGTGTLTKTGAGQLAISGSIAAFAGKIAVAEGAGSVTIGEGDDTITISAGQEVQLGVYTWTGAGTAVEPEEEGGETTYTDTDLWSNVNNWLVNGSIPATAPAADSTVVIPAGDGKELTIKISNANEYTGYLTINRDVKFARTSSDRDYYNSIYLTQVSGSGTLTLEAGGGYSSTDRQGDRIHLTPAGASLPFQIDTDLVVNGRIRVMRNGNVVPTLTLNGALKGTGYLYFNNYHNGEGARLNGDTSEFAGVFEGGGANGFIRDATKFDGDARGSASAYWKFGRWDQGSNSTYGFTPFLVNDVTYQFGQLDAPLLHFWRGFSGSNTTGATVEVGALAGKTSTVTGSLAPDNTLRKVGATSTLNYTNSGTANGTVEAYEGTTVILGTATGFTLKFTGTDATIKIARSSTTTTVVTPAVADDPETEENEYVEEVTETTTTTYIPATFVPGFADALVGCQYEVAQETVDNVTYDVYTVLTDVATDSAGTTYDSVALALAAIAADETGTLEPVVTLAKSTTEAVTLPLGYSLVLGEFSSGTVTGVAGVAVSYNEETQTYTTVDNSEATWQGAAAGANWADAANWSTGFVPNEGTKVVFNYDAIVFLTGNNNHDCGEFNIAQGKEVTLAPAEYNQANWPRVRVSGDITSKGECTLKLFRCGIDNAKADGSAVAVRPTVTFENDGEHDSWMTGSFDLRSGFTGTGLFIAYGSNGAGRLKFTTGSITVPAGSVVDFRGGNYPTYGGSGGNITGGGLNGSGRVIIHTIPGNSTDRTYFQAAFKNAERWTGTCELAGLSLTSVRWLSDYGNENSTVSFNNTTTYLYTSSGTGGNHNVGIEVASGGLTIGGTYSQGNFVFPGKLTGTGTLTVAINGNNNKNVQFTGDCSEFAGTIAWASGTANTRVVVGDDTSADFAAKTIVVNEGATIGLSGFGGTLVGNGTVSFKAATTLGTFGEGWTGVAVADFALTSGANCQLNSLGTANSVVANGQAFTGHLNGNYSMVPALRLDNDFTFNNGSSSSTAWPDGKITKFSRILGDKNLNITWDNPNTGAVAYYEVEKIDGSYTGTINVSAKSALRVDEVALSAAPEAGVRLATIAVTSGGALVNAGAESVLDGAAVALTVGGVASEEVAVYDTDGLYVAVAKVGDNYYATYAAAATAAEAAVAGTEDTPAFTVVYGDGVLNGWDYDSEAGKLTKNTTAIARVGTTNYNTLAAAFEAAGADDTVVLFGTSDEAAALEADDATLEIDTTATYTGTLSGDGTVVADKDFTPAFGEWTGTFVVNWTLATGRFVPLKFGNANSTVKIATAATDIYFANAATGNAFGDLGTKLYFASNVSLRDGWGGDNQKTTFPQLGADEGVVFTTRLGASTSNPTYYDINLVDFAGSFVVSDGTAVNVTGVNVEVPAFGTKVVSATVGATAATISGKIAEGYPLVFKDDGLYFDPVAQVGEAYYNTLAEAITAANGATVTLVGDTTDGYEVQAGQTVKIFWNGHTTGAFTFAANTFGQKSLYEETTDTTTFSCTAPGAYATVGGTVTYYATVMEAYNAANAGAVGDSFTVLSGETYGDIDGFTYDSETATYTKVGTIASITVGIFTYNYTTLANAVAAAEANEVTTVTLLVAKDSIEEAVPEGWEYNTPEASETEFGTLTKVVIPEPTDITVDTDGCNFTVDATTAAVITEATGVATTDTNFGKAAIAYVVGGVLADGEVVIPTPTITVNGTTVTVVYDSETAHASAYTVTCTLYSLSLEDVADPEKWTVEATGEIGAALEDTGVTDTKKFYKVGVTVEDKQLVSEEVEEGTGA